MTFEEMKAVAEKVAEALRMAGLQGHGFDDVEVLAGKAGDPIDVMFMIDDMEFVATVMVV